MNTKNTLSILLVVSSFLCVSCAEEWSFNLPYYLLLGGIEESVDEPFVSIVQNQNKNIFICKWRVLLRFPLTENVRNRLWISSRNSHRHRNRGWLPPYPFPHPLWHQK